MLLYLPYLPHLFCRNSIFSGKSKEGSGDILKNL
jgi:hypothetical protein